MSDFGDRRYRGSDFETALVILVISRLRGGQHSGSDCFGGKDVEDWLNFLMQKYWQLRCCKDLSIGGSSGSAEDIYSESDFGMQ